MHANLNLLAHLQSSMPWFGSGPMKALLVSAGVVALAEIGDKTQLLAFIMSARYQRPVPIAIGMAVAIAANHALAGVLGAWITTVVSPPVLRWALVLSFIGIAGWTLIPDSQPTPAQRRFGSRLGVFGTTVVAFFLAEMGDKTQVATVVLAARYGSPLPVIAGTVLGMLVVDVPAIVIGSRLAERLPMRLVHGAAAAVFVLLGLLALLF